MELSKKEVLDAVGKMMVKEVNTRYSDDFPFKCGDKLFIRTVTHYFTGRLVQILHDFVVLEDVCWIGDTGRYGDWLAKGTGRELEPYPPGKVAIGRGAVIDISEWKHELPREQK